MEIKEASLKRSAAEAMINGILEALEKEVGVLVERVDCDIERIRHFNSDHDQTFFHTKIRLYV